MELNHRQKAEAFSKHEFKLVYPFFADNLQWNIIGGEIILSKEKVIEACEQNLNYLNTTKTDFIKFSVIENENYIIIETIANYNDSDNNLSKIASCDIYLFENGLLKEITSYNIELK